MKIAILGYGVEGKAAEQWYKKHMVDAEVVVLENYQGEDLSSYDLAVRSPGIPPNKIQGEVEVTSGTIEFFRHCPAPIIGVTGTKGKGTTASFITAILRRAGRTVHLLGNIGAPALATLDQVKAEDVVVYELSSFQLWDLGQSPHITVLVPIELAHLDMHGDMANYLAAKAHAVEFQTAADTVIYDAGNKLATELAARAPGQQLAYPTAEFAYDVALPGAHNRRNAEAAVLAAGQLGVNDPEVIQAGLLDFRGLPHRLELVRERNGVRYIDDSISTAGSSLRVAVESFAAPIILITGGYDQQLGNAADLAATINRAGSVRYVILTGQTGPLLAPHLEVPHEVVPEIARAVPRAAELAEAGDIVLLSPAAQSFDAYKNYAERGEKYQEAVNALPEEASEA